MLRLSTSLGLAALLLGSLAAGCYDSCDRRGDVRCNGNHVEVCGRFPSGPLEWSDATDCGPHAVCSAEDPKPAPDANCIIPDLTCEVGPTKICAGDIIASCEYEGAPARHLRACEHGCVPDEGRAFCRPSPAPDSGL
jgi:hypothetical protein